MQNAVLVVGVVKQLLAENNFSYSAHPVPCLDRRRCNNFNGFCKHGCFNKLLKKQVYNAGIKNLNKKPDKLFFVLEIDNWKKLILTRKV